MTKVKQVLLESFMESRNNNLLFAKSTMDENGKATIHDPHTGRPLIAGDGCLPQINRFAGMYSYAKMSISVFNKAILAMTQKSERPQGNEYVFICNERLYADIQNVLAEQLMQFHPVDAAVYSKEANGKIKVGAEYSAYTFMGNTIIFHVDRALSIEYPDKGYAVLIDLTADKTYEYSWWSAFIGTIGKVIGIFIFIILAAIVILIIIRQVEYEKRKKERIRNRRNSQR
jgi:hypothetical protein